MKEEKKPDEEKLPVVEEMRKSPLQLNEAGMNASKHSIDFAWKLFKNKVAENSDSKNNMIISPMSISTALSMLAGGADGDTYQEILTALRLENKEMQDIYDYNSLLVSHLTEADNTSILYTANAIWTAQGITLLDKYRTDMEKSFKAGVYEYDFSKGVSGINQWIESHTGGRIKEVLPSAASDTKAVLANALYLRSGWDKKQF